MTAIYQRSRPIHWDEVVGQEHVKNVLRPALERGRIGHAYLFSGPRGVGKTTTARLIAMTVNCDSSGIKPCGQCESCKSVIAGRHPDVLEVDAASNNSVDDVRDLREKVALQPMRGSKKVYILDEAHMMSKSAFNALLKTLEEPPSHAVFVLATTEPERLPPTILSRCQHYRFRRLSAEEIAGKLGKTAGSEGVNAMPQALALMARAADGAMRDGESLLERLLAAGEPTLTLEMVESALGLPPQDRIENLAHALASQETAGVMQSLTAFYSDGFAPRTITERVKIALRDQLHNQLGLGKRTEQSYAEAHLLRLIKALDEEDARFARSSDLLALEMAFTKALVTPESNEGGGVSPALESRVSHLEKQVRGAFQKVVDEGLRASGQRPPSQVPEFDPMSRAQPRRPAAPPPDDEAPFDAPKQAVPPTRELPREAVRQPAAAPSGKGWADVILKADIRMRAILKEGKGHLSGDTLVVEYTDPKKHKWHADQVASKLEMVSALVQQVIGAGIGLELVMPDGTKKNSRIQPSLASNEPSASNRQPSLESAARLVPVVLESLANPVSENSAPSVHDNPDAAFVPEPSTPPENSPPVPTLPVVPALHGNHDPTQQTLESQQAFQALQTLTDPHPKAGLFTPAEVIASLESDNARVLELDNARVLEPNEPSASQETALFARPSSLVSAAPALDDLPPEAFTESVFDSLPPSDSAPLETYDLETAQHNPPLAALEMDFGDLDAVPAAKQSSLAGHPNYQLLAKLFAHRVREVGQLEPKIESSPEDSPAAPTEENE
jgi:DNA polymerase III subunit gamma/tau